MNGGGVSARQLWSFDERRRSSDETAAEFGWSGEMCRRLLMLKRKYWCWGSRVFLFYMRLQGVVSLLHGACSSKVLVGVVEFRSSWVPIESLDLAEFWSNYYVLFWAGRITMFCILYWAGRTSFWADLGRITCNN
jgi:hypothetical protein